MAKRSGVEIFITENVLSPVREFISDSRSVGIVLLCCTIISLVISNTTAGQAYTQFWEHELNIHQPGMTLPHTPLHIINDLLMAIFFLLVGIEIKRELLVGELAGVKKAILPIIAALGGMIVPACIYLLWTGGNPLYSKGWGIPMATDIAFSLGILSMLGKRVPFSLKIFLMALAIIDDLGGILTIAIFYAEQIDLAYLLYAGGIVTVLTILNLSKVKVYATYLLLGLLLWYMIFNSGVHATIAGVLLAFTIPLHKAEKLEHALHDPVNFIILPLFALANTAIILPDDYSTIFSSPVHHGVLTGLLIGKPLGIFIFTILSIKSGIAAKPADINLKHIAGAGMIAGIGFTISIFMTTLAFSDTHIQTTAKVAIILASVLSGFIGFIFLRATSKTA